MSRFHPEIPHQWQKIPVRDHQTKETLCQKERQGTTHPKTVPFPVPTTMPSVIIIANTNEESTTATTTHKSSCSLRSMRPLLEYENKQTNNAIYVLFLSARSKQTK